MDIIATIGPATENKELMAQMTKAGVTIWRNNMSFGGIDKHRKYAQMANETGAKLMMDTAGPEIRIVCNEPVNVKKGEAIDIKDMKFNCEFGIPENACVKIDDGNIIAAYCAGKLMFKNDGKIENNKRVNIAGAEIRQNTLTENDVQALIMTKGYDMIGLSFTRDKRDVEKARALVDEKVEIIAKIENHSGVENIEEILDAADGIMVARGDLAMEVPYYIVPAVQKHLIMKAKEHRKKVYVATQMLYSMQKALLPTRAEANDVFNAIYEGADGIMLSNEITVGENPLNVILTAKQICNAANRFKEEKFLDAYNEMRYEHA